MRDNWCTCRWGDLATLEYGKALRGYEYGVGQYPVYGTNGLIGRNIEPLCKHPGVIIGRKGAYRGVHYSKVPFFVIDTAFYLEPKTEIDLTWAYYELLTQDINSMDSGSAIPSTSRDSFYNLHVRVPPLSEQHAIAHILGTLDDKIELNRRMNETLEAMARAIFKSWFVDFDPVRAKAEGRQPEGMDADTAALFPDSFEDSPLGKIPKGWKISSFDQLVEIWSGGTPQTSIDAYWNGDIPWFTVTDAPSESDIFVIDTGKYITQAGVDNSATRLLPVGTTIISARGTVGKLAMVGRPMAMNQTCYGLKGKKGYPDPFIYFQTKALIEELKQRTHGCVFDTIIRDTFKILEVASPPPNVAEAFGEKVEPILQKIYGNLLESRTLAAIRDALLPKLLSGEVRVKDPERFFEARM